MASDSVVEQWIIDNKRQLNLSLNELSWPDFFLPGLHDFSAKITVHGETFFGRGTDFNRRSAMLKSIVEAIERATIKLNGLTLSTGMSAHSTEKGAKLNSYHELLQFDRVFCHHFAAKAYSLTKINQTNFIDLEVLKREFSERNVSIDCFSLTPSRDAVVYVAIMHHKYPKTHQGIVCGFGASSKHEDALEKALIECLREGVGIFFNHEKPSVPLETLYREGRPSWHFWNNLDMSAKTFFYDVLHPQNEVHPTVQESLSIDDVTFSKINTNLVFNNCPITVFSAHSDALATPEFCTLLPNGINAKRIARFSGKIDATLSPRIPHFYG